MTTESGSDSESKDKEQDQQESPAQQGAAETQPQDQQQQQQQLSEEHQNALEQFSAVAAHSTPVKKEQVREPEHARSLYPTTYVPTYCSWEVTSLVEKSGKYIFRYAWQAVWCDAADLDWLVFCI